MEKPKSSLQWKSLQDWKPERGHRGSGCMLVILLTFTMFYGVVQHEFDPAVQTGKMYFHSDILIHLKENIWCK